MTTVFLPTTTNTLEFEVDRTAVIVVDMQNDFGSEGGMFALAGVNIAPIKAIVPAISRLLAAARDAGIRVVYLKQQHKPDLSDAGGPSAPHFIKHQRLRLGEAVPAPDGGKSRILVEGNWGTDIVDGLRPEPGDLIVGKHRFSGFFETELHVRLQEMGITTLLFAGATTSVCVESTLRDAMFRDYTCIALSDCTAEPLAVDSARSNHEASLLTIEVLLGWVAHSGDLLARLTSVSQAAE